MNLFTSEKVLPYVYLCTHKISTHFYIGYRGSNKQPSHLDLPKYKTSSKTVKPNFDEYDWIILAEFFDAKDAFIFEQNIIQEHIKDPLCLNKFVNKKFVFINKKLTEKHKKAISNSQKGKSKSKKHCANLSKNHADVSGKNNPMYGISRHGKENPFYGKHHSDETKIKLKSWHRTEEIKQKMRKPKNSTENMKGPKTSSQCPYCKKIGSSNNMKRFHFEKCSLRKFNSEKISILITLKEQNVPHKEIQKYFEEHFALKVAYSTISTMYHRNKTMQTF
jgi:hypothetical protein